MFDRSRTLEALDPDFVCTLCTNENEAILDDLIQVTFTISPQVRDIVFVHPESLDVEDFYFRVHFSADVKPLFAAEPDGDHAGANLNLEISGG